jgi:phosphoglycerate dehydrogenase-like enzyme
MRHQRKNNNKIKVVLASTPDQVFFDELWNKYSVKKAEELGIDVQLINESREDADKHWPELLADADAIITTWNSPQIDEKILMVNNKLKIVGHAAGSVANYVSPELFERGVKVTSANSDMAHSVAEWCLMAALMGSRQVMNYTKFGMLGGKTDFPGRSRCGTIQNATVGIWGFGTIASALRNMLIPLAPSRVLVNSGHMTEIEALERRVEKASLERIFTESDIIFLLAGLNHNTKGRIDAELLASIKDNAILINAGRGSLVQEEALINELSKGRFTGIFDVFHEEPLPENNPLQSMPNVILTPHNGGYPSRMNYISTILEEFNRFFKNEQLLYMVQQDKIKHMTLRIAT